MRLTFKDVMMSVPSIIGIILFLTFIIFYTSIRPFRIYSPFTPAHFNVPYEKVAFHTQDNVLIKGWFIPNKNPHAKAIILLHGYPADKGDILPSRLFLHKHYHLLLIDFRYFGESGGWYTTAGRDEVYDVLAAVKFLKDKGIKDIGLWGFSFGGAVALMAAPKAPEVKAVVAESSYSSLDRMAYDRFVIPIIKYPLGLMLRFWGLVFFQFDIKNVSPVNSAKTIVVPVLLMHSKQDNVVSFENALLIQEALKNNKKVDIVFWDDLYHGQSPKDYEKTVEDFFQKYL